MTAIRRAVLTGAVLLSLAACGSSSDDGPGGTGGNGTVSGEVQAPDGKTVPGCTVTPEQVEGDSGVPEMNVVTTENGTYTWPLPPGTYNFTVVCDTERDPSVPSAYDGLKGSASDVEVTSGETRTLNIRLT
ncbi:carboxypeptidase-like regulatory domain-containing protein [Streptomyces sp. NBC_00287]|uniref:carboxypeptidase-like regulatory domain-containing protein n=1 Tax=Streptomyces sp. NBC_00287 TaxID=2975702 RepID=UPI002E2E082A|nr:carboxypeptidase-like regulatory domain-containing protein [Streptomyces sp. NBC_00287]